MVFAEFSLIDDAFDHAHFAAIRDAIARIGVADVRAFGLTWEACEQLLDQLRYSTQVSIVAR